MSDIYINTESAQIPRPPHGNNCHGHFTSISAGGLGHWKVMVVLVMVLILNQI